MSLFIYPNVVDFTFHHFTRAHPRSGRLVATLRITRCHASQRNFSYLMSFSKRLQMSLRQDQIYCKFKLINHILYLLLFYKDQSCNLLDSQYRLSPFSCKLRTIDAKGVIFPFLSFQDLHDKNYHKFEQLYRHLLFSVQA